MAESSKIEWTDSTWTPIRARRFEMQADGGGKERIGWHCEHESPGCINCYAEGINMRLGTGREFKPVHLIHKNAAGDQRGDVSMFLDGEMLGRPLRWKRPRMIFVCSMTDLAAKFVRDEWIVDVLAVVALAPRHTFQALTKRADRLAALLTTPGMRERVVGRAWEMLGRLPKYAHDDILHRPWPLLNLWVGASVEDQRRADERRAAMAGLAERGWLTWVSYEPALEAVDWSGWEFTSWVVSGGESGTKARPSHPDWHRTARDFCAANRIAYNFKQWGAWKDVGSRAASPSALPGNLCRVTTPGRPDHYVAISGDKALILSRVGKKVAGRLLDGVTHDGFPEMAHV